MTQIQIIPGNFQITDPSWPKVNLWLAGRVFTSDDFTGSGDPVGALTNTALGGQPVRWEGTAGAWQKSGGKLVQGAGIGALYLPVPGADYELATAVETLPSVGSQIALALRRESIAYVPTMESLTLQFYSDGGGRIDQRHNGAVTNIGTFSGTIAAGDTLRIQLKGSQVTVLSGGRTLLSATTAVVNPGYAGYASTQAGAGMSFDNLAITPL